MKDGDKVRGLEGTVGVFVQVDAYTAYINGKGWKTPVCTVRDLKKYWKVVPEYDEKKYK